MPDSVIRVRTSSAIRIFAPAIGTTGEGRLFDTRRHRSFRVDSATLRIVEALHAPRTHDILLSQLASLSSLATAEVKALLDVLEKNGLLFQENITQSSGFAAPTGLSDAWCGSLEYHLLTRNFRFLNYSPGSEGPKISLKRMDRYASAEPDTFRFKVMETSAERLPLEKPGTRTASSALFDPIFETGSPGKPRSADFESGLLTSLSFALGISTRSPCPWSDEPFVRRTSPSGGSRHPTEGYVFRLNGDAPRVWHVQSDVPCLVELAPELDEEGKYAWEWLKNQIPDATHAVLLSSLFSRNMFRYREPRTFRSVHMDAGHLAATLQFALSSHAIPSELTCHIPYGALARLLGLDPYEEGPMCCVFVSPGVDDGNV